jgi:hypothetical protein
MGGKLSLNNKHNGNNLKNKREQSKQFSGPRLSLDEVYESLEDYKETINNIYCLNDILDDYSDDIIEKHNEGDLNPINSVLLSTLHESYDKNAAINYCEVIELAKNKNEVNSCRVLFTCKHYEELDGMNLLNIKTNNSNDTIDELSYATMATLLESRIIEMSIKIPAYGKNYIHSGLSMWTKGIRCYFNLLRKNPIDDSKWIMISSGINLKDYSVLNVTNLNTFSREYKLLLESITQVMNSNSYLNVIETSATDAEKIAESAISESEEKTALFNFAKTVYENAPNDAYAKLKLQDAQMSAQTASRMATQALTNVKAAQYALTEAEAQIATKTTTWEYGTIDDHENLHCVYSGLHPQWNGLLISDCNLRGSEMDIPGITFSVMSDIEKYYTSLNHNQTILCTYKTPVGYYISIVKVIKHGDEVHIQMKEAQLNSIFNYPSENTDINNNVPSDFTDTQLKPDIKSYIFIDPTTYYIGIGTNQQLVKYSDEYTTTKPNNVQHVVIKSKTYPNVVNARVAEDRSHRDNYYFFDQFSCATMRRESEIYNFKEMYSKSELGTEENDNITQRYGGDISFEITDKTKTTCEIGNVGMVIDKIDEEGNVYGGLSVKTIPNIDTIGDRVTTKPGNTIMYVSSEGLLHISGVMLGSKILHVQESEEGEEELFWGDSKIM